jgi:hypothetical protein
MDSSFFAYLQQLELMAFFSGYPLVYVVSVFFAENQKEGNFFKNQIVKLLPVAYAFVGTLYLGLLLKNFYPDYSIENLQFALQNNYLKIWGLLSLLFWLPVLAKKPVLSLLHSLVFFFFLLKDLYLYFFRAADSSIVKNAVTIYSKSLILNFTSFILIAALYSLAIYFKRKKSI